MTTTAREVLQKWRGSGDPFPGHLSVGYLALVELIELAFASRSVEEARREERERCAAIADEIANSWEQRADEATAPTRRMLCNEIAVSHRLNAAAARRGRYAPCLPDAPERDGS